MHAHPTTLTPSALAPVSLLEQAQQFGMLPASASEVAFRPAKRRERELQKAWAQSVLKQRPFASLNPMEQQTIGRILGMLS